MPINPQRAAKNDRGFALLITITLLAFLVLLLVSLASLTRVETQVAANNQQIAQARQNALMAMNVALGRLQQLAGPDQRVTGTADLVAGVNVAKQKWTGVWKWDSAAPTTPAWLVSTATTATSTGNSNATSALPATGTVTLVGAGSTDITVAGNEVKVETQSISSDGVPGFSGPQTVGNFAYWVGDEGVKAKVSITDPWESPTAAIKSATGTDDVTAAVYRFVGAQRNGIEGVSFTGANTVATDKLDTAYPATNTTFKGELSKVMSRGQLALANPAGQTALNGASKARFHDITASSFSVMTNVADGGLKKDLTAWLRSPASATNLPLDSSLIFNPAPDAAPSLPKWGLIRSYAGITSGAPVNPQLSTDTQQGIHPVVTYCRLGFNVSRPDPSGPIHFQFFPVVVLWNPYNVPIAASSYNFNFDFINDAPTIKIVPHQKITNSDGSITEFTRSQIEAANSTQTPPAPIPPPLAIIYLYNQSITPSSSYPSATYTQAGNKPFKFPLNCPQIPAGQSLTFTLDNSGNYVAGSNTLSPHDPSRQDNSVIIPGPVIPEASLPADLNKKIWFLNTVGNLAITLTRPSDDANYQVLENVGTFSIMRSSPLNTAYNLPTMDELGVKMFVRVEQYLSQAVHGTTYPAASAASFGLTPRWIAQFNPTAPVFLRKPRLSTQGGQNSPSLYMDVQGLVKLILPTDRAYIGAGGDVSGQGQSMSSATLPAPVENDLVLREFQPAGVPLFSLAQLQHAGLSLINLYPVYAVGNSLPNIYVKRDQDRLDTANAAAVAAVGTSSYTSKLLTKVYDLSYVLNKALWDKYYFSTIPSGLAAPADITTDYRLPNSRHSFYWKDSPSANSNQEFNEMKTTDGAAAHLLINGGFNVNSTSVQAWRALLYTHNGVATDPSDVTKKHPISRYTDSSTGVSNNNSTTDESSVWRGHRILSDAQLDTLAAKIVTEVRTRGPFMSLADFINRKRVDPLGAEKALGLKGALQAAIDATDSDTTAANRINAVYPFNHADRRIWQNSASATGISGDSTIEPTHWVGTEPPTSATAVYGLAPSTFTHPVYGTALEAPSSSRAAFAPGYLTQADLLTTIGPVITARSDTFVIRAYGDVQNPATNAIEGKAWCEAIVQRLPDYVETTVDAWTIPAANTPSGIFGRKFKIVSFRWLSSNDI